MSGALTLHYLCSAELARHPPAWWRGVLGAVAFGDDTLRVPDPDLTITPLSLPLLDRSRTTYEIWRSARAADSGAKNGIHYRQNGDLLFGHLRADAAGGARALEHTVTRAYRDILALAVELGYAHVLRVWNYVPGINLHVEGEERYRRFNRARQRAFHSAGRSMSAGVPAACALGVGMSDRLTIYFLASRSASQAFENPRQMPAHAYPPRYGTHSPTFSRACLSAPAFGPMLFVSGTASIVGHESRHAGDVGSQTLEALRNVETLLEGVNRARGDPAFTLRGLSYKAYLRDAADYPVVRATLQGALGSDAMVLYVVADICREDLLMEIEAAGAVRCVAGSVR